MNATCSSFIRLINGTELCFGEIILPASKSESNRALMIAAYGGFHADIQNLSASNDTRVLAKALREIKNKNGIIDIADCGTAARFLTTYLACHNGEWMLTGTERMKQRPIQPLVEALLAFGSDIQFVEKEGFLPIHIYGKPIQGGKVAVSMTQSSQFVSSLLLAAPGFPQGLELELVGELNSLPYLEMTLSMMRHFCAEVERSGRIVIVNPRPYQSKRFRVSPDWSAASYWYEMAAFSDACEIKLRSLRMPKDQLCLQGDAVISEWMVPLGVGTFCDNDGIVLRKIPFEKRRLSFDFSQHPDLYPTMAATCAGLNVEATFSGLDNLAVKESDRVDAMQTELAKLSQRPLRFCAHNDHRIVMALAPLAILYGPATFDHLEVVQKSYPRFWEDASFLCHTNPLMG